MMDLPEFEDLLGRLGEDLSTWPAPQHDAANALLGTSEKARHALADAVLLREALRTEPTRAPAGLAERILRRAREMEQPLSATSDKTADDGDHPAPLVYPS
jgi:hypothetical protein